MRLTEKEYYKYLEIHPRLIHYVGQQLNVVPIDTAFEEFMTWSVEEKFPVRNLLYENINLVDDFIKENPSLSNEDIEIINGFKDFREGRFTVVKLTKKYAHFFGDKFVYAVHALSDPFQYFWGNNLPVMIETVLLPYKGKIIYDGVIQTYPVHFGKGIRNSIKNDYLRAERKYGIITTLPEDVSVTEDSNSLEKELIAMMKTKSSREHYWYEIEDLLEANPKLMSVYIKELGRINSRKKKKELKSIGIKKQVYAIYNDTIVTSGNNQKEVEKNINEILSDHDIKQSIFYFKL